MKIVKVIEKIRYKILALRNLYINKISFRLWGVRCDGYYKINGRIKIISDGDIRIGEGFLANSGSMYNMIGGDVEMRLIVAKNAVLEIGRYVGISNTTIVCREKIEIGDYVYIGGGCKIWDTDFHSIDPYERRHNGDNYIKNRPIKIHEYAFIGANSIILKGVTIGKNSIIGAGSVVRKNVPDNQIWAGNPAIFIKDIKPAS